MLTPLLIALLALPQDPVIPPDERAEIARVELAISELDEAMATRIEGVIVSALYDHREVEHPEVIARVGKLLRHRKNGVQRTAIDVLRKMKHADALKELELYCEKDERLHRSSDLIARTLRAIAQHADPGSMKFFVDPPFESVDEQVLRVRIRGLGRFRTKRAVAELMSMVTSARGWKPNDFAKDFRISLHVLTGIDRGIDLGNWERWWNRNGEEFEVGEKFPDLPRDLLHDWCTYWELPLVVEESGEEGRGLRDRSRGREDMKKTD